MFLCNNEALQQYSLIWFSFLDMIDVQMQKGVAVVEQGVVSVFTTDGRDYVTALPFPVSSLDNTMLAKLL